MFNWLNTNKSKGKSPETGANLENATVRVIGDRASGKTTYMASLVRWPNANPNSLVQTVAPFNEDGENLISLAQNILEQGLQLEPTTLVENTDINDLKDYGIRIILKGQARPLTINCKDYSGEFFTDLLHRSGDILLEDYLNDCILADGILYLVDGNAYRKDNEYINGIDKFLTALDRADTSGKKRRIAFVITKCELPDLWVNRHKPKDVAQARFAQVCHKLESWQALGGGSVDYFTTSAFGMLGTHFPEPNSKQMKRDRDGVASIIKSPKQWRPFGLVSPIYWLCTGSRHKQLDQE